MNERLADLYGESLEISIDGDSVSVDYNPRKFAELIIQECANLFPSGDNGTTGIGTIIKNHFGI